MPRAVEFVSSRSPSGWRRWLGRILRPLAWFSPTYRKTIRHVRALEKAQKARNGGDTTAVERFWRADLARAKAAVNPQEKVQALSSLGFDLANQKRYSEAEEAFRQSQQTAREFEGPAGFWSLGALDHLGMMAREQGRESDAEAHFLEALHTAESELGPDHHRVAFELLGLANFYHSHGRRADEIAVTERILAIHEKQSQAAQPSQVSEVSQFMIPSSLARLAALYAKEGRDAEAETLYRRVFDLTGKQKGAMAKRMNRTVLLGAFRGYAALLRKRGREEEAAGYENQVDMLLKELDPSGRISRSDLDNLEEP